MEGMEESRAQQQAHDSRYHTHHALDAPTHQVLDNVDWDLISSKMGTRNGAQCMEQWCVLVWSQSSVWFCFFLGSLHCLAPCTRPQTTSTTR